MKWFVIFIAIGIVAQSSTETYFPLSETEMSTACTFVGVSQIGVIEVGQYVLQLYNTTTTLGPILKLSQYVMGVPSSKETINPEVYKLPIRPLAINEGIDFLKRKNLLPLLSTLFGSPRDKSVLDDVNDFRNGILVKRVRATAQYLVDEKVILLGEALQELKVVFGMDIPPETLSFIFAAIVSPQKIINACRILVEENSKYLN